MASLIWCERLGLSAILLEQGKHLGGQLLRAKNRIIDYPGLYGLDGRMFASQWTEHVQHVKGAYELNAPVSHVDFEAKTVSTPYFSLSFTYLICATGARERRLGIPGEAEMAGRGEVYSTSGNQEKFKGKKVLIVGGGDRAFEGALKVADQAEAVKIIHRRDGFRARKTFTEPAFRHPNIAIHPFSHLCKITGDKSVRQAEIEDRRRQMKWEWPADIILIRIGIEPNSALFDGKVALKEGGYVETDAHGRTSLPNVYAVGDVVNVPEFSSIAHASGQAMAAVKAISLEQDRRKAES